jgi:heme b synthase
MHKSHTQTYLPRLIAFEVTRTCDLKCRHCRASAEGAVYDNELTLPEITAILENVAVFAKPIIILTGGDPLKRPDIDDIIRTGTALGLRMVMSPCGKKFTARRAAELRGAGLQRISISLDGANAATHDAFRGVAGAFDDALAALQAAKDAGLSFQINTTVSRVNLHELDALCDLAEELGAEAFSPFLLVPTGRGREMADEGLSAGQYEQVLNWLYERKLVSRMHIRPTCAPHFYRILRQRERAAGRSVTPDTHGLDAMSKGCMGGQSFAFISHTGTVQICGFLDVPCGDLRQAGLDFQALWNSSPVFRQIRSLSSYHGRCGRCEYRTVCGGCRARAYALTGDYLAEEPYCLHEPAIRLASQAEA